MSTMKRNMLLILGGGAILIGAIVAPSLTAKPSTYYPTVQLASPTPQVVTVTPAPTAAPVATHAAAVPAPAATKAPAVTVATPAPTVDPRCYPHYSTSYINDLLAGMKATGYTQAQIDDARFQAFMVQGWQSSHCF